jgi:gamma-glutamylcyclotransferase
MKARCPNSQEGPVGRLQGYRLGFTFYSSGWGGGAADIIPDSEGEVWGLTYRLSADDLHALDAYEGHPTKYRRLQVAINASGTVIPAVWTYTVVAKQEFVPPKPAYLAVLTRAAERYGFPSWYRRLLDSMATNDGESSSKR